MMKEIAMIGIMLMAFGLGAWTSWAIKDNPVVDCSRAANAAVDDAKNKFDHIRELWKKED